MLPKEAAIALVCLCLYLIVRDDINPLFKRLFYKKKKQFKGVSEEIYYNKQMEMERRQRAPEYN